MKLYKFTLSTWNGAKIYRDALEVEEKPKTYIKKEKFCNERIYKSDVGHISGYGGYTLYLLEDDIEKAKSMFAESLKCKIKEEKQRIEITIKSYNERIEEYENGIAELLKGEEG